ncbi:MAG: MBL fold metallo-hydrolase [Candidatus Delongbacteria bacterium]|jgi:glyoxylase-like metal-dependent hydrolase (beta-lactamase superfamily II)|nr:MBL fold metallo-hydrolase [Candidatus Delongbacteria bacterium]
MDSLHIIPDGNFEVRYSAGRQNSSPVLFDNNSQTMKLGSNCLLIQMNEKNILVDTGTGLFNPDKNKYKMDYPRLLLSGLKGINIAPSDIDIVVLTHFHFDHCGGCMNENEEPVFSNAIHYIQASEVENAMENPEFYKYWTVFENVLEKNNLLRTIEGNFAIENSIELILSPGHTTGFQYIEFQLNDQNYIFPGDIIPTLWHLNNDNIVYLDHAPEALGVAKNKIIENCIKNDAFMIFQHSTKPLIGKLTRKENRYGFQRIK